MELRVADRDVRLVVEDPAAASEVLAGLVRGSDLPPGPASPAGDEAAVCVAVIGGLDAGRRLPAPAGTVVDVGRAARCGLDVLDATVSRRHARLVVGPAGAAAVSDLGSRNGTWLVSAAGDEAPVAGPSTEVPPGSTIRIGSTEVAVVAAIDDAPVVGAVAPCRSLSGTTPFNRPPRAAPPPPPDAVEVPEPPRPPGSSIALGVVTVLAPIAMAAALVVAMGNPVFALFALLSPVVAIGNHVESKRRTRRTSRRDAVARAADLERLASELAVAVEVEVERRRTIAPDPAEVLRRAEQPSTRLWERRLHHDDALHLRVGVGDVPWDPPLAGDRHPRPPDAGEVVAAAAVLPRCPATIDAGVVGIVGPRPAALAVARSLLCQAAVHHGPADLPVLVAVDVDAVPSWDWAKWLPHVEDVGGTGRRLAAGRSAADAMATAVLGAEAGPPPFVVVDGDGLLEGRRAPVRSLLAGRASGVVVSSDVGRLPAACTAVVVVDDVGVAELHVPATGRRLRGVRVAGMADDTARRCARALARFDDPELDVAGAGLPDVVRLPPLLGLDDPDAGAVGARWRAAGDDPPLATPIGMASDGVVEVDLVADGPHGLVAGTTGAGKSELLRTLVAGLAAGASPDHLSFVLIDFKGGSAFDACARLPHVVGLVTDLDEDLAERALRCLDAELRHRERLLRDVGATDLATYRVVPGRPPLPRLVVVVDEFATLKAELPDFVRSLVGVAQRGRSLGVHLVLATQRPSGAVGDDIRANTALRIALRVHDAGDSTDVVDVPDAAQLPRHRPGRACLRLGPAEIVTVQTALVTAPAASGPRPALRLERFCFGPGIDPPSSVVAERGPTDLDLLVDACSAAWRASGRPAPRRPWPDPLPASLDRASLPPGAVALADDPDHQTQVQLGWRPADGNLAVYGIGGSGTTTTLLACAVALAEVELPGRLHLYAVDHGAGELTVLGGLPHTGAVVAAAEGERQRRLVRWLRAELDRRRSSVDAPSAPDVVVLIDGVAAFLAQFDDVGGLETLDAFERVFADGPEVGLHVAVAADRAGALPSALSSLVRQRWVHRLADPLDAGAVGVTGRPPALVPGRFVDTVSGLVAQVGRPADGWRAAVAACAARWSSAGGGAAPAAPGIAELPRSVLRSSIAADVEIGPDRWVLPVALADDDLAPAALELWDGEHALVAGPNRSGRTSALATIAGAAVDGGVRVLAVAGRRSWLPTIAGVESVDVAALASTLVGGQPTLVIVDEADATDDEAGLLERLVTSAPPGLHVVAAGRAESLRGLYGHWTRTLRRSRVGILLRPHLDLDGELLGTPLPRRVGVPLVAGRGFLVADGVARLVQVALPA